MPKKPRKPSTTPRFDKKKVGETLNKIGGAMKQIVTVAAAHPCTAAMAVMALSTTARLAILAAGKGKEPQSMNNIMGELSNVYLGAQGIATASALAPIVAAGIGLAGQFVKPTPTPEAAAK